jgi:hypothetical protein
VRKSDRNALIGPRPAPNASRLQWPCRGVCALFLPRSRRLGDGAVLPTPLLGADAIRR